MKALGRALVLVLAINFLAAVGGVLWLYQGGQLTREKVGKIKEIVFAPATQPTTQPAAATTQPDATTQPILQLDELLAKQAGRPASEQVEFIQRTFDAQMAQLDQRMVELTRMQQQVDLAKNQLAKDRATLEEDRKQLTAEQQEASRLLTDKGFQDSLQLYMSMPAKQVKTIFMTLDDKTVVQYLEAMPPRTAARIIKEFKTNTETTRIEAVMEKLRQAQASAKE